MRAVSSSNLDRSPAAWRAAGVGFVLVVAAFSFPSPPCSQEPSANRAPAKKLLTVERIFSDPPLVPPLLRECSGSPTAAA